MSAGTASVLATLGAASQVRAAEAGDYKALVCVFLYGGNDAFNMVVPRSAAEHATYANARQSLAVGRNTLLPLNPVEAVSDGADYGLHPAMAALQPLFNDGRMAVLANVGALVEPVVVDGRNLIDSARLPPQLFSHNDQQSYWQSFSASGDPGAGWGGRIGELLASANANRELALNINLGNANDWQVGLQSLPYNVGTDGVVGFNGFSAGGGARRTRRFEALRKLLAADGGPLFAREFAAVASRSIELQDLVGQAFAEDSAYLVGRFPDSRLGGQLAAVARMIAAREALGQSRQIFFVGVGGWDTHSDQLDRHPALLTGLAEALAAFYAVTRDDLGVAGQVTTFTMSDFGRTLTSNGDGSDHGWGGHHLVLGDSVRGRRIFGEMPLLDIDGPYDAGRGRIIPTTAVDEYGATLARWFGVTEDRLDDVFPNLRNFDPDRAVDFMTG